MPDRQSLDRTILPFPVRGCSSVGNGCGAGFLMPLQERGISLRIARITRISAEAGAWIRLRPTIKMRARGQGAICSAAVHWWLFWSSKKTRDFGSA